MSKILFYGSFDPIHLGHIEAANVAMKAVEAEKCILKVTPKCAYKEKQLSTNNTRQDLILRAVMYRKSFDLIGTMEDYHKSFRQVAMEEDCEYVLMGADNIATLERHLDNPKGFIRELLSERKIIILSRADDSVETLITKDSVLYPWIDNFISVEFNNPISSTDVRNRIATGEPYSHLVPPSVSKQINKRNLYNGKTIS